MGHFFSPNSSRHLRSDAHQSQIDWGDADVDHAQTFGGIQWNYWGDIFPRVSAPLEPTKVKSFLWRSPGVLFR